MGLTASNDRTLKVWDVESGRNLRTLEGDTGRVNGVAASEEGRRAISASADGTLKVWDVESGRNLLTVGRHGNSVNGVAVSRDGRRAVSASNDQTLKVWDVESRSRLASLKGHTGRVNGVAMSGNGRQAISASEDNTLRVWDLDSGLEFATFTCEGAALCCAFCGSTGVIAGDAGGHVYLLDLILPGREFKGTPAVSGKDAAVIGTERGMAKKHVFLSYCRDNKAEV
jgi:WD40 repeat protein